MKNEKIGRRQIARVLQCIAVLEGWNSWHPSISVNPDGSYMRDDDGPVPSEKLLRLINAKPNRPIA